MDVLTRWMADDGSVVIESDADEPGYESIGRRRGEVVQNVEQSFEDALVPVRKAAQSALLRFRDTVTDVHEVEIEFGVKLNAVAGAVIAKTSAEGHLTVRLKWKRDSSEEENGDD